MTKPCSTSLPIRVLTERVVNLTDAAIWAVDNPLLAAGVPGANMGTSIYMLAIVLRRCRVRHHKFVRMADLPRYTTGPNFRS